MKTKEQRALLKKCRHKAEIPATIVAIALTVLFVVLVIFLVDSIGKGNDQGAKAILTERLEYEEADIRFALKCGKYLLLAIAAFLILKLIWELFKNAGIAMVQDIPVKEEYVPGIYKEYLECCEKLGIKKIPRVLLAVDKDNLESTGILIKSNRYLRVDQSSLDDADTHSDNNIIRFEVIHDLAHIAYHHYSYPILIATVVARRLPFVKNIYSRIMCYSADKLTAELIGREECITVLLEKYMMTAYEPDERDEYVKRISDIKLNPIERLSAALNNLTTDTPSYIYRLKAIIDDKSGKVI